MNVFESAHVLRTRPTEQSELLQELREMQATHIAQIEYFKTLPVSQLIKRPEDGSWNILECVDHLNLNGSFYIKEFQRQLKQGKARTTQPHYKGVESNLFNDILFPNGKDKSFRKIPTLKSKKAVKRQLDRSILDTFLDNERALLDLLAKLESVDLNENFCSLTISHLKFNLGDTLRFHIHHNEEHMVQAMRVLV